MQAPEDIAVRELLSAYAHGVFPMAASATTPELYLQDPEWRGIIPLNRVELPRRLARTVRQQPYDIRINTDFDAVIDGCAEETPERGSTWINREIRQLYGLLHERGYCHTIEAWQGRELVGGLYGVTLKGAYFGESMFSRARDASKIALIYLCARLIAGGFRLLDTQFTTPHLAQFGTIEIMRRDFQVLLQDALEAPADYMSLDPATPPTDIIEIVRNANTTTE